MTVRAVLFDIYGTLLDAGPPPPDADARWASLCRQMLGIDPPLTRLGFSVASSKVITRRHEASRALGIPWPEVQWPSVAAEILPALARLPPKDQEEFLFRHIQTGHTTRMSAEAAALLRRLKERGTLVGIASNAQAYTLRELQEALALHGLGMSLFDPVLSFWSFEHGFSKPDPHVFQILTARLEARGISPAQTLMAGDRLDNDVQPAQARGWQTWHFTALPSAPGAGAGNWNQLIEQLQETPSPLPVGAPGAPGAPIRA